MTTEMNPGKYLKQLSIIYGAMFTGILIIVVLAALLVSHTALDFPDNPQFDLAVLYIAIGLGLLLLFLAHHYPQTLLKKLSESSFLDEKLKAYQKVTVIRLAFIEAVVMVSSAAFVITENTNMLLLVAIAMLFFILNRPSRYKTAHDLRLNAEETDILSRN